MFFPLFRSSSSSEQGDDLSVKGFTWKQGFLKDDKSLTIKLLVASRNEEEEETNQYIAELSNEGRTLTLMRSSQPFLTLELYDAVEAVKNISLSKNEDNNQQTVLEIQLDKKKANDNWPWLLTTPLRTSRSEGGSDDKNFPFFSEYEINKEFLRYEIPALPSPSASASASETRNKNNNNTNENQEENSLSLALFYSLSPEHEQQMKERIEQQVGAFEKEFEALEQAKETYRGNADALTLIENLLSAVKEKRRVRSICPVTVSSVIQTFEIEIKKMLLNLGVEGGEDDDSTSIDEGQLQKMINADDEHSSSIGDQLYNKATADPSSPSSIQLLRYAAIKFHHEPSVLLLHQLYSSTEPKHRCPARAAYFILRQALFGEKINKNNNNKNNFLSNRLMSDLISGGGITENCSSHAPFSAVRLFSLAVFFSQRAAVRGDALSLVRLAQLFSPTSSTNDDDVNDPWKYFIQKYKDRSDAFLQLALDHGVTQAYLMKTMYHLNESKKKRQEQEEKEQNEQKQVEEDHHFTLAKQYFQLVRETDINEALRVGTGLFEEDVKY